MIGTLGQVTDPFASVIMNPPKKGDVDPPFSGNMFNNTDISGWYYGDNATVEAVADGYFRYEKTGGELGTWGSGTVVPVVAGTFITMTLELLSGTLTDHIVELTINSDWSGGNGPGEFTILEGPGTFGYTGGGQATVNNLSATIPTRVQITREVQNSGDAGISQWPGTFANTDGVIFIRHPQIELGKVAHPFQPKP